MGILNSPLFCNMRVEVVMLFALFAVSAAKPEAGAAAAAAHHCTPGHHDECLQSTNTIFCNAAGQCETASCKDDETCKEFCAIFDTNFYCTCIEAPQPWVEGNCRWQ